MILSKGSEKNVVYICSLFLIASLICNFSLWSKPDVFDGDLKIQADAAFQYVQALYKGEWVPQFLTPWPYFKMLAYAIPTFLMYIGVIPYFAMVLHTIFFGFFSAALCYYICRRFNISLPLSIGISLLFSWYPILTLSGVIVFWGMRRLKIDCFLIERIRHFTIAKSLPVWLEAALIALVPCCLLFNIYSGFYSDWYNHLWTIGYTGSYFLSHFNFPDVLNTQTVIGNPRPFFYGSGLYNVLGIFSVVFTPHVAILLGTYAIYYLQHGTIVLLLTRMNIQRWFASMTALVVTFAIYPLSNLYNRGALTEFFSTVELTIAITTLLLSFISNDRDQKRIWYVVSLVMFGLMSITHPITLLNAGIFMALLCPMLWLLLQIPYQQIILPLLGIPLVLGLLLSSWLYATLTFYGEIAISRNHWLALYDTTIDWTVTRLSPVLFDRRVWHAPFNQISTPYLDAPINMFLLGLTFMLLIYVIRQCSAHIRLLTFVFVMSGIFLFYLWCSLSAYPYDHILPAGYRIIQLPYRLVSFINLTALCTLFGIVLWLKLHNRSIILPQGAKTLAIVLCTVATCAFVQKIIHAAAVQTPLPGRIFITSEIRKQQLQLPGTFYSTFDYVTSEFYAAQPVLPNSKTLKLEVAPEPFGNVKPLQVNIEAEGWYATNIYNFAWNKIIVDGYEVLPGSQGGILSVYLTPGQHEIKYAFSPPLNHLWPLFIFRSISTATVVILFLYLFYSFISQSRFFRKIDNFI